MGKGVGDDDDEDAEGEGEEEVEMEGEGAAKDKSLHKLQLLHFLSEVLAHLPYTHSEEPLHVIYLINRLVSIRGPGGSPPPLPDHRGV